MKKPAAENKKAWTSRKGTYSLRETDDVPELGHLPALTRRLLVSRGIATREEADAFLEPDFAAGVHDPFLMKGMAEAADRIVRAVRAGERIAIWSDYDADGIPGGVVLHDLLKKIGHDNFENYIPHRHNEGFGLNAQGIETLARGGANLVVTVDCGIADAAEVAHANSLGLDVIVTDHHLPGDELPPAFAVVDPKQEGCTYPFKDLCGAGVAFKLAQAVLARDRFGAVPGWEKWLLDMVGLATLSDMVPLVGENRVFAFYGLKVLRKTPRVGLIKLARSLGLDLRGLTEDDIGFTITPRINAASRMGVPQEAFDLLSTKSDSEADRLSSYLNQVNDERKGVVASIAKEAKRHFAERHANDGLGPVLVAGNPEWRPSLLGLVANTLVEEYKRPVFLWGREGGSGLKGSCRSDGSVSVVELMSHARHAFLDYGGHKMSGGFSLTVEHVDSVEAALAKAYEDAKAESRSNVIELDRALSLDDVNWDTYGELERLAPFGLGNPKPTFVFEGVALESVRTFGKGDLHLELKARDSRGRPVTAIAFFSGPESYGEALRPGRCVNLVATLEKSVFRGRTELRMRLCDIVLDKKTGV